MVIMEWKDVEGYNGRYSVSDSGEVRSNERTVLLKNRLIYRTVPQKMLTKRIDRYGYLIVCLKKHSIAKWHRVHRLVACSFIGHSILCVNHKDMNKKNNNLSNLEFVSVLENNRHARMNKKFMVRKGDSCWNFKIDKESEKRIKYLYSEGVSHIDIAAIYKIHPMTVYKIIKRP